MINNHRYAGTDLWTPPATCGSVIPCCTNDTAQCARPVNRPNSSDTLCVRLAVALSHEPD